MDLIHINRKIFNRLKNEKDNIVNEYVLENIVSADEEEECSEAWDTLTNNIVSIIRKNELIIEKYGIEDYYNENYPLKEYESGYRHSTGKYGVIPFDWSMSSEIDENWSYSFQVFKVL
jgi:hypothetical protein